MKRLLTFLVLAIVAAGALVSAATAQPGQPRTTYSYDIALINASTRLSVVLSATEPDPSEPIRMPAVDQAEPSTAASVVAAEAEGSGLSIGEKIAGQMGPRGWTEEAIGETVANPAETHSVWDYTTGSQQPATAYVRPDGSYVVVNDSTGTVVQVSDSTNPNWKPVWNDPRFQR